MVMNNRSLRLLGLLFVCLATKADAAEPTSVLNDAVIHLTNGDYVTGRLIDSEIGHGLAWQSPAFTAPFQFATRSVNRIQFTNPEKPTPPKAGYHFELAGGDVLFGSLVEWQGDEAVLDVTGLGRLHVERTIVRRISRWRDPAEEAGYLITDQISSSARRVVGLPPLARIEFELSWKDKLDFELDLGGGDVKDVRKEFRFEVWESQLVIMRQTEKGGEVVVLWDIPPGSGRLHLQAFLDQPQGRMLVFTSDGRLLAELTAHIAKPQSSSALQYVKRTFDVRLERLSISSWDGETPRTVTADQSWILMTDGSIKYDRLKSFDAARREFVVENTANEQRIAENMVRDLVISHEADTPARSVQAVLLSGQKIGGDLLKVEQGKVWLKSPGIREELAISVETLQSLMFRDPLGGLPPKKTVLAFPTGRLEFSGTALCGRLVETEWEDVNSLVWKPALSRSPSALQHGMLACILYREPSSKPQMPAPTAQVPRPVRLIFESQVVQNQAPPADVDLSTSKPRLKPPKPVLYLHSGDRIPCDTVIIDETGITFAATRTDAVTIRHDQLRALELQPGAPLIQVPRPKLDRLLILPRTQRDNPPTHLIQSVDGDCLRGRLVSMNEQQLQVEVRLETRTLPRDRVARLIWLQPDEVDVTGEPQTTPVAEDRTLVQAIPRDGNRLTFVAEQLAGSFLSGRSNLLGDCRVDLQQIDQLLIGPAINQSATTRAFAEWKLKPAIEPVAATDGDGSDEGRESVLVGKLAPDFALELLDGTKFRLSEHRDKILVLDFWASWCGPCLQTMPQIDKVVHEFSDRGVDLVAINLEESKDKIQTTLERLKLKPPVALDRTGQTAAQYGATSIPQTVIIDRNGKVVRLFVGGGTKFGDQLRTALQAVVSDNPAKNN